MINFDVIVNMYLSKESQKCIYIRSVNLKQNEYRIFSLQNGSALVRKSFEKY